MSDDSKYDEGDFIKAEIMGTVKRKEKRAGEWWYVLEVGEQTISLRETETK